MDRFAVVIPAHNEESTIRDIASRAHAFCESIIVVNDGSSDRTRARLEGLDVTLIDHERNLGKAAALWDGMCAAINGGAETVITIDADGQHRPEDIPLLLEAGEENPDTIVIGARLHNRDHVPSARYRANRVANFWISWAAGYAIQDSQSGFRLYPATLLKDLNLNVAENRGFVFESEVLIEAANRGFKSVAIPIAAIYSSGTGASHFRPVVDISRITIMITGRLLRQGLKLPGLYRSYFQPKLRRYAPPGFDGDALLALVMSLLAAVPTLGLVYLWLMYRVHKTAFHAPLENPDAEAVIVLGHRLIDGQLSSDFKLRLDRAIELISENRNLDLIIVGGRPEAGITEADAGQKYLIGKGVAMARIFKEDTSSNSVENLVKARPYLPRYRATLLVSNRYHLERILTIAKGMDMTLAPCAAESRYSFGPVFARSIVEAFYLHWYWAGRIFAHSTKNPRMLRKIGRT